MLSVVLVLITKSYWLIWGILTTWYYAGRLTYGIFTKQHIIPQWFHATRNCPWLHANHFFFLFQNSSIWYVSLFTHLSFNHYLFKGEAIENLTLNLPKKIFILNFYKIKRPYILVKSFNLKHNLSQIHSLT